MGLSNDLSHEAGSLSCCCPNPHGRFQSEFSIRGLRLYFPELEPWVAWSVWLPTVCPVYLWANVVLQGLLVLGLPAPFVPHSASLSPATATRVLSTPVPVSAPPTSLDVFIFYFLGVGPPCCLILCQFWLCEEAQCVYLRRHLGSRIFAFNWRGNTYIYSHTSSHRNGIKCFRPFLLSIA